jgi:hypothetical protein
LGLVDKFLSLINPPKEKREKGGIGLDLGCGQNKHKACIGIDKVNYGPVDIVHDLNKGIPIKKDKVDEIFLIHVLEHLDDWVWFLGEVYRVCKDGAIIHVEVPYYKHVDAYTDPQHKHLFTESTFKFVMENKERFNSEFNFEILSQKLHRNIWLKVDAIWVKLKVQK